MSTSTHDDDVFLPERRQSTRTAPRAAIRIGRVVSAIPVLFLIFDGVTKLMMVQPVVDGMKSLGYPLDLAGMIGKILLACLLLYVIPQTSVFGAILLTGYLGGAVASQFRIGLPLFTNVLFPVYVALFLWVGLYLREARLRALVPFRRAVI
jgi:hypothetical protein